MAHDFASRQRKKNQPEPSESRVRGAVPKPPEEPGNKSAEDLWDRLPGWGWLGIGLLAGLLLAQLLPSDSSEQEEAASDAVVEETATAVVVEETQSGHQPRFDFYTLLPESEVIAPKIEAYQSTPRDAENLPRFMLQTGSFRQRADAEQQKRRILDLGFDNVSVSVAESATGTWYRVRVGPYQDRRLRARAQDDLAAAGLEFMLLSLRDEPPSSDSQEASSEINEQQASSRVETAPLTEDLTAEELAQRPRFMVQVGSFRRLDDAEKQRGRLQELGFDDVSISDVQTASGDTWQRVQIGPYQNPDQLAAAQEVLRAAEMDFMLLRLRQETQAE